MALVFLTLSMLIAFFLGGGAAMAGGVPRFEQYPIHTIFQGRLAAPKIVNREERRFRSMLTNAVRKGYDVVEGGTENERVGPNFAGRYVLVQWGCGSNCMEAALIDGRDGTVLRLPQIPGEELDYFGVPTGSVDMRTLEFRRYSRLLRVPRITDGMTYAYVLEGHRWQFLSKAATPEELRGSP